MLLWEFSPITQRRASTRFDLPQPFGPTIPVSPGSIRKSVGSTKVLKPTMRRRVSFMRRLRSRDGRLPPVPAGLPDSHMSERRSRASSGLAGRALEARQALSPLAGESWRGGYGADRMEPAPSLSRRRRPPSLPSPARGEGRKTPNRQMCECRSRACGERAAGPRVYPRSVLWCASREHPACGGSKPAQQARVRGRRRKGAALRAALPPAPPPRPGCASLLSFRPAAETLSPQAGRGELSPSPQTSSIGLMIFSISSIDRLPGWRWPLMKKVGVESTLKTSSAFAFTAFTAS